MHGVLQKLDFKIESDPDQADLQHLRERFVHGNLHEEKNI